MGFFDRFRKAYAEPALPLYQAVVAYAREPHWYLAGEVPDTLDGRFDMVATITAMVLLRFEIDPTAAPTAAHLAERFVDDMDAQVRQIGFGDMVVGKQIGRMLGMLGGRLGAYRTGLADGTLDAALVRNLYRGNAPTPAALAHVQTSLVAFRDALAGAPTAKIERGMLP